MIKVKTTITLKDGTTKTIEGKGIAAIMMIDNESSAVLVNGELTKGEWLSILDNLDKVKERIYEDEPILKMIHEGPSESDMQEAMQTFDKLFSKSPGGELSGVPELDEILASFEKKSHDY
jgi:hypothetical protein